MSSLKISKIPKAGRMRLVVQWYFLKSIFKHPSLFIKPTLKQLVPSSSHSLPNLTLHFSDSYCVLLILFLQHSNFFSFYNNLPLLSYPLKFSLQPFSCFLLYLYLPNKDLGTKQINQESSINPKIFLSASWLWFCSWLSLVVVWTWFSHFILFFSHTGVFKLWLLSFLSIKILNEFLIIINSKFKNTINKHTWKIKINYLITFAKMILVNHRRIQKWCSTQVFSSLPMANQSILSEVTCFQVSLPSKCIWFWKIMLINPNYVASRIFIKAHIILH